jgi:glyoxylase-like metal-dependent hydrolase (beta-lactamase superfamily II)
VKIGTTTLTRVGYVDVAVEPAVLNLTVDEIERAGDVATPWVDADRQPYAGLAAWVVESDGVVVVVDPVGAVDEFIRKGLEAITHQDAVFAAFAAAGISRDSVDVVALSHLDGIGLTGAMTDDGSWEPAFPNARIVFTAGELEFLAAAADGDVQGLGPLRQLIAAGVVEGASDGDELAPGVTFQVTGGHSPGHAAIRVESGGELALLLGHLALHPLELLRDPTPTGHLDPAGAKVAVDALLAEAAARDAVVIGPLWGAPGAARISPDRVPTPV